MKVSVILLILVLLSCHFGWAQSLSDLEKKLVKESQSLTSESLQLLEEIVNINSGTENPKGVQRVASVLKEKFEALGLTTRWIKIPVSNRGGHLFASTKGPSGLRMLIIGHMDTVFGPDSSFQKFKREGDRAWGPGVNDAKGGIVVILSALKALKKVGLLDSMRITVALMGDEEMPAKDSEGRSLRPHLKALGQQSDVALGFEYAVESIQKATIARRGWVSWTIEVLGEGGHSSQIFSQKAGEGTNFSAFHDPA